MKPLESDTNTNSARERAAGAYDAKTETADTEKFGACLRLRHTISSMVVKGLQRQCTIQFLVGNWHCTRFLVGISLSVALADANLPFVVRSHKPLRISAPPLDFAFTSLHIHVVCFPSPDNFVQKECRLYSAFTDKLVLSVSSTWTIHVSQQVPFTTSTHPRPKRRLPRGRKLAARCNPLATHHLCPCMEPPFLPSCGASTVCTCYCIAFVK